MKELTLIIPVYNEAKILMECIYQCETKLKTTATRYEIIIVDDCSSDGTDEVADSLASETIKIIHTNGRIGKGASVADGIKKAKYDTVVFMDADLSTDLNCLDLLLEKIDNGTDIVVGSRFLPGSKVKRSLMRDIASRGYNIMVTLTLGSINTDHQCGFKAVKKSKILGMLNKLRDNRWFWDTELLVCAQRNGLKICEIPINWRSSADSKINLVHIIPEMVFKLILMRFRL